MKGSMKVPALQVHTSLRMPENHSSFNPRQNQSKWKIEQMWNRAIFSSEINSAAMITLLSLVLESSLHVLI